MTASKQPDSNVIPMIPKGLSEDQALMVAIIQSGYYRAWSLQRFARAARPMFCPHGGPLPRWLVAEFDIPKQKWLRERRSRRERSKTQWKHASYLASAERQSVLDFLRDVAKTQTADVEFKLEKIAQRIERGEHEPK